MTTDAPLYASPLFQRIAGGTWRPGGLTLTRHALELCALEPGSEVLDIGCGQGASLSLLRDLGFKGTGLDKEYSLTEPFPFVQADAQQPPFLDASFDAVLCECVLSLLPDAEQALRRFAAVLRQKGRLILTDLYIRQPLSQTPAAHDGASCLAGARSRDTLEHLLRKSGFHLLTFEDHTASLKDLAARLLWYGDEPLLNALHGRNDTVTSHACATSSCRCLGSGGIRYGYGLWIATPSTHACSCNVSP